MIYMSFLSGQLVSSCCCCLFVVSIQAGTQKMGLRGGTVTFQIVGGQ